MYPILTKEPHEMTWKEFRMQARGNPYFQNIYTSDPTQYLLDTLHTHRKLLVGAIEAGKHVAFAILREHYLIE